MYVCTKHVYVTCVHISEYLGNRVLMEKIVGNNIENNRSWGSNWFFLIRWPEKWSLRKLYLSTQLHKVKIPVTRRASHSRIRRKELFLEMGRQGWLSIKRGSIRGRMVKALSVLGGNKRCGERVSLFKENSGKLMEKLIPMK